ncbi:MAG: hypothetical protein JWP87_6163 [Labilithrix sp.]|nr:hypothetical protein [Labilithrix sp.]
MACIAVVAAVAAPATAHAGENGTTTVNGLPDVDRARAAYDRGVRANAAGDYANAARAFAEADALAPQPASLEAALESAMKADDALLGAELVDRADGRAPDAGLRLTLEAARKRFAKRTGKIKIDCHGEARCLAAVDGAAADARKPIYVAAGPHAVVVQRGEERIERLVEVKADVIVVVSTVTIARAGTALPPPSSGPSSGPQPATSPTPPTPPNEEAHGIPRGWFFVGLGLTAVVGGVTVVSGLDAVSKHDRFKTGNCASGGTGELPVDCGEMSDAGKRAQTRTNVLVGATAVLAVTTAAIGIFAVRWRNGTQARLTFGTSHASATAGLEVVTP